MDIASVFIVAVALAMDAFSVSVSCGMAPVTPRPGQYFRLSFHFGLFQFLMPLIGYAGGAYLETYIRDYDHWVAFALLAFIGLKMIRDAFSRKGDECAADKDRDPSRGWSLILLSVATSIDALAVGISLGVLRRPILIPSIIIGIVCALFSAAGVGLGRRVGPLFGKRAEAIGGIMLLAIAVKIVIEHTMQ